MSLVKLGDQLFECFHEDAKPQYIEVAMRCQSISLKLVPRHEQTLTLVNKIGSKLATCYYERFQLRGEMKDLDIALEYLSQAVSLTPNGNEDLLLFLVRLGMLYTTRYSHLDDPADIEKAIESFSRAVSLAPDGHESMPISLNNLASSYEGRFERLGKDEDLEMSMKYRSRAVSLTPNGHRDLPSVLSNLGASYQRRFQRFGGVDDLEEAIKYQSRAVSLGHDRLPNMAGWLNGLGCSYLHRFRRFGRFEDLEKAIEYISRAVSLTPDRHTDMAMRLSNLGGLYQGRFERLGEIGDLEKAIEYHSRAVSLTPDGNAWVPVWLCNLASSHEKIFERFGKVEDLEKAIEYQSRAVTLAPVGHAEMPCFLSSLGSSHLSRFKRLGRVDDLEKAVEYNFRTVAIVPDGHKDMPMWLNNLGGSLVSRFEQLEQVKDLEKAMECQSRAVSLTPDGHANLPRWLGNLGSSHETRFRYLGQEEDFEKAIEYRSRAVSLTPDEHADLTYLLRDLGLLHWIRYQRSSSSDALARSIECFRRAALSPTGRPRDRLEAALHWSKRIPLQSTPTSSELLLSYQTAIDLIPRVVWLGETIAQRYTDVQQIANLGTDAAANAISLGKYNLALEWLEQGRSVVWNQTLQLRTPFDELSAINPMLGAKLQSVATKLNNVSSQPNDKVPLEQAAREHRRLATLYDELVDQVRAINGFEDFMRPKKTLALSKAAREGPVVVVNVNYNRCDALVLKPGETDVHFIPLPNLKHFEVAAARENLDEALKLGSRMREAARRPNMKEFRAKAESKPASFEDVLGSLWSAVAEPILDSLGYLKRPMPNDNIPRITWCTTGPLSFLPIHASGLYDNCQVKLFNFAVSSYTPTLGALLSSQASADIPANHSRILAIGQEGAGTWNPLPATKTELALIQKYVMPPNHYQQIVDHDGTKASVLAAMEASDWVHLACHASQDAYNPTESGFKLHDGMLSLSTIMQKSLSNKGLAFLSACETAMGDKERPDESVHLASGMLLAGYPSVIASMWSIKDSDAPVVANGVYSQLLKGGRMNYWSAAKALHDATNELRNSVGEKQFERWVPYIHIGV